MWPRPTTRQSPDSDLSIGSSCSGPAVALHAQNIESTRCCLHTASPSLAHRQCTECCISPHVVYPNFIARCALALRTPVGTNVSELSRLPIRIVRSSMLIMSSGGRRGSGGGFTLASSGGGGSRFGRISDAAGPSVRAIWFTCASAKLEGDELTPWFVMLKKKSRG